MKKTKEIDYKKVQLEFIRALKGKRTSAQVSGRMGRKFNVVARWISGASSPSVQDFSEFARACSTVSHEEILQKIVGPDAQKLNTATVIRHLIVIRDVSTVSRDLQVSKNTVYNWLASRTEIKFTDFMKLLHLYQFLLLYYVSALTQIDKIPSLNPLIQLNEKRRRVVFEDPSIEAAMVLLNLNSFQNIAKDKVAPLLATYMGREISAAENMIKKLTDCQMIEWHKGKLSILESKLETGAAFQEAKGLFNHWSREFTDFLTSLQTPPKRSYAGYFLVGVNEEGEAKLREEYFKFMLKVRTIASENHTPVTSVKAISLNIMDFADRKEAGYRCPSKDL